MMRQALSTHSSVAMLLSNAEEKSERSTQQATTSVSLSANNLKYDDLVFKRVLGQGAYGVVKLATWQGKDVAVKQLRQEYVDVPEIRNEFNAEANMLSALQDSHVVKFYGAMQNPKYCIVTEYVPGCLFDTIEENRLSQAMRYKVIYGIASSLRYLHAQHILHRDIKIENILLDNQMNVKLCDFGFSIKIDSDVYMSQKLSGTPAYVAPEVWVASEYSNKSDIYSLGVCIWEMMSGVSIFSTVRPGPKRDQLIRDKVISGEREEIPKEWDENISDLIRICWAQDPQDRPTAQEVLHYLDKYVQHESKPEEEVSAAKIKACCAMM